MLVTEKNEIFFLCFFFRRAFFIYTCIITTLQNFYVKSSSLEVKAGEILFVFFITKALLLLAGDKFVRFMIDNC